ncbi:hypothetical protein U0070_015852, partial [Myodes glareolus]
MGRRRLSSESRQGTLRPQVVMASDSRGDPSRRGAHSKVRLPRLLEVLSALEGDEFDSNREEIFFAPPNNVPRTSLMRTMVRKTMARMVPSRLAGCCMLQSCLRTQTPRRRGTMTSQSCNQPRKGGGQQWNLDVFGPRETPGQTLVAGQLRSSYRRLKTKELSPIGLFEPFFDYEQSRYAQQKNITLSLTAQELKCVLGILILIGYISYLRQWMFWETAPDSHGHLVADAIRRDRFELTLCMLQITVNSGEQSVCQGQAPHRPYELGSKLLHSGKPVRLGYKICCGMTSRGYLVWFAPSQGSLFTKPNWGLDIGGCMVVRFVDALQERGPRPYHISFDKVFTSFKLMSILRKKKKRSEGHRNCMLTRCHLGEAKAWTQDHPPSLVKLYREKARGVDRMDQNIAKYKVKIRAMKWYLSFISYIIDAALNSAWQLHRVYCQGTHVDLLALSRNVAHMYLESNADTSSQGGWSWRAETENRFDMIGHWIVHQDKRPWYALCHSQANTRCEKCQKGVHAKYFREYHT